MSKRKKILAAVVALAAVFFAVIWRVQDRIDEKRRLMGYHQRLVLMPGHLAGSLVLAGFRGLAADLIWLQIEDLHHSGQYYKMLPYFQTVTYLQPNFITPWAVGGWHMAYNISVKAENEEERWTWINRGLDFLKEGITYNPERYDLYFELGWTYYNKVEDFASAVEYFARAAKFPRPEYVDNVLAHALFRAGRKDEALALWRRLAAGDGLFKEIARRLIDNVRVYGHPTKTGER